MERSKKSDEGFTLLELVIAIALSAVVLLAASSLLINFGKFSTNVVKSEGSLMGSALGAFEEITGWIAQANKVVLKTATATPMDVPVTPFPATCADVSCIQIRVDTPVPPGCASTTPIIPPCSFTPSNFADDTVFTYWQEGNKIKRTGAPGDAGGTTIAGDSTLSFSQVTPNSVGVTLVAYTHASTGTSSGTGGTDLTTEHLSTTVIMRSRSANLP